MELRSHVNIKMFILYLMYWVLFRIDPFQHPEWVFKQICWCFHQFWILCKRVICAVSVLPTVTLTYLPPTFVTPLSCHLHVHCFHSFTLLCCGGGGGGDDDDDYVWCNVSHLVLFIRLCRYFVFIASNSLLLH